MYCVYTQLLWRSSDYFEQCWFHRWTAEELRKVIAMLRNPDFDSKNLDPDLHKRMNRAVDDGSIKSFNKREGSADGDQDLNLWLRELEDMVCEIMEDPIFKGNQNFKFEMDGRTVYVHCMYNVCTNML